MEGQSQNLREPLSDIFIEQLRMGNSIRMIIKGRSMHPFIKESDVVIVKPIKFKETRVGDIIAYRREASDDTLTVHRMIKKKREYIVTKGDASRHGDVPIYPGNVCGKVISLERKDKVIDLETRFHRLSGCLIACLSWSLAVLTESVIHPHLVLVKIWKKLKDKH